MNYIGNVIKQYRSMIGMSRKELAADVCSDKYLYMIEKGKRTPSTEITRLLGDKMGADLFQYYEYLDCADPIGVSAYIDQFNRCRRGNSYKLLAEITEKASKTEDFKKDPWQYEIQLNRFTIQVISKGESIQAIPYIQNIIEEMEQKKLKNICYVYFLVLLSTCYLMQGDLKNARKLVSFISDATKRKQSITKYAQAIVVAKSNKISMHYLAGELDLVIEESLKLNEYQN